MSEKDILAAIGTISLLRWCFRMLRFLWSEFNDTRIK